MNGPDAGPQTPGVTEDHDRIDEAQDASRSSWGLWMAVLLLTAAAFAAGILVGIVADGNAEIMREFRERSPSRMVSADGGDRKARIVEPSPNPIPEKADGSGRRRPNNQVDWAITIAPGTNVGPVDVRTADLDADSKIEFGMMLGNQISPVATLWVNAASSAKIVLPNGRYSVRTTRLPTTLENGTPEPQPTVVDGTLDVRTVTAESVAAVLSGNRTGGWRIASAQQSTSQEKVPRKTKRRQRSSDFEYEGLGEAARTGGTSTYGQDD